MKLYYFNPNSYGQEAFVCAESKEKAIEYLLSTKSGVAEIHSEELKKDAELWHKDKIDRMINCKNKYTIDEFEVGQVVFSEIC